MVKSISCPTAEMMGMRLIYLEGGSGASKPVPVDMVSAVSSACEIPVMVGGGLRTPEEIRSRVAAGAKIIVVGNAIEQRADLDYLSALAAAVHNM